MCGVTCGIITTVVGAVLVVVISTVGYVAIPGIIESIAESEVTLKENSLQMERFEEVPFPLNFTVRVWNITNRDDVLAGGVPVMNEVGPYRYKLYQSRIVDALEEDEIHYRIVFRFEFDAEASYPNTEEDMVTITNAVYHAVLQVAERMFPVLMPALAAGLNGIFGQYNNPIIDVKIRDLLFDGIRICDNPGLIGAIACTQVRDLSADAQNLVEQEDGSLLFSLLSYRDNTPSLTYVVNRGLQDSSRLGEIALLDSLPHLLYWVDGDEGRGSGRCNMINGTDSGIFAPFINREESLWAINTDICRSVEMRYQQDLEYEGIPVARFSLDEWFLDNNEGCFCLNVTSGINREDGCLLEGAMEIYTCVGAFLVLSYPHFLYADPAYRNGVIGMNPSEEDHRIFMDLEPLSGTVVRGQKRAQFNVFMRPVTGIAATQNLLTTLTPIVWIEEGMSLPEEFVNEMKTKLLAPLNLLNILIPILIAVCAVVFLSGLIVIIVAKKKSSSAPAASATTTPMPRTITKK